VDDPELDVPGLTVLRSLSAPIRKLFFDWVKGTGEGFALGDFFQWLKDTRGELEERGQYQALESLLNLLKGKSEDK
jgi:hypothetical protein